MPNLIPLGVYKFPMNRYFTDTWNTLRKRIQPALSERNIGRQETLIKGLIPEWDAAFLSLTGNLLTKHDLSQEYTLSDIMAWPEMAPKGTKGRIFVTWSCRSLVANTIPEATALRMERVRRLSAAPPRTPLNLAQARVNTLEADRLAYVATARKLLLDRNIPEDKAEEMAQASYQRKLTQLQLNVARLSGEGGAGAAPLPSANPRKRGEYTDAEKAAALTQLARRGAEEGAIGAIAAADPLFQEYMTFQRNFGRAGVPNTFNTFTGKSAKGKNTIATTFYTKQMGLTIPPQGSSNAAGGP
jgi:hypothetical protein